MESSFTEANPFEIPNQPEQKKMQTLDRDISPPPSRRKLNIESSQPSSAAVEAGQAKVEDKVGFFDQKIRSVSRPLIHLNSRISHEAWLDLYKRNLHPGGHHFVVHQHDHPVAGTHYDLRLQCNETSSISFAIMYGLPGDPNSRRLNRNATETRVHCLWNHLIETASHSTGTMLIWDTGEYNVLPYYEADTSVESDEDLSPKNIRLSAWDGLTETRKLHHAFAQRKIRLRLNGTRLPQGYTVGMRLSKENNKTAQPLPPKNKRRRLDPKLHSKRPKIEVETSESEDEGKDVYSQQETLRLKSMHRTASPPPNAAAAASEDESEAIRKSNAYPGARNDIGSIHQRRWYLSMDRSRSGFLFSRRNGDVSWIRKRAADGTMEGFEAFNVLGRDVERSVVTGRLAKDVLQDEGVQGYVPRGLWRPVTE
ncbi:MAG: hypothetical protein Q9227_007248 [Pyrenula ochraceoflavens]